MSQFKEDYMKDFFKNEDQAIKSEENSIILESVNKSYLEVGSLFNFVSAGLNIF